MSKTVIDYKKRMEESFEQLQKGAFLTSKKDGKVNTMTIAWGGISFVWYKPVFVAYVRYSRDTYQMLEDHGEFTVSIPLSKEMKKELAYAGSKSGRDTNKIADLNLTLKDGLEVDVPILADCDVHYECKVIYKQAMEPGNIPQEIKDRYYNTHDYHVIYYGEILANYELHEEE
jgi:flavin reductase (DIM6/NTAB) family NADH-FMN oxidoreductase RutF